MAIKLLAAIASRPVAVTPKNDKNMVDNDLNYDWFNFMVLFMIIQLSIVFAIMFFLYDTPTLDIQFDSASFTSLGDASDPNLNAKLDINFIVANPSNKYNISCDVVTASLFYGGEEGVGVPLATARVPPFSQLKQTESKLPIQLNVANQFVGYNLRSHTSIEFGLEFFVTMSTVVDTERHITTVGSVHFYCERLSFVFKSNNVTFAYGTCLSPHLL